MLIPTATQSRKYTHSQSIYCHWPCHNFLATKYLKMTCITSLAHLYLSLCPLITELKRKKKERKKI
ncbi:hypothetical protein X975_25085, partial [Stegodyphus mimosarum]